MGRQASACIRPGLSPRARSHDMDGHHRVLFASVLFFLCACPVVCGPVLTLLHLRRITSKTAPFSREGVPVSLAGHELTMRAEFI